MLDSDWLGGAVCNNDFGKLRLYADWEEASVGADTP